MRTLKRKRSGCGMEENRRWVSETAPRAESFLERFVAVIRWFSTPVTMMWERIW